MSAQNAITGALGSIAGAGLAIQQARVGKMAKTANKVATEEEAKKKSYIDQLNLDFGKALGTNPNLKDKEYFNKALDIMEEKKSMMFIQREATRAYRNSLRAAGKIDEANAVEKTGQARKEQNFADFRAALQGLGKRKKKGGK